jgi:ElaA protein
LNWKIRKFNELTLDEIYEILKSRNEVFIVEQNCAFQDCDDKDQNSYHLLIEDNEFLAGYLRILEKGVSYNEVSIGRVLVVKEYRKKGIARDMILKAIDYIHNSLNEKAIRISAQSYLVDFYKSIGFKEVSEIYYEDNIPHIEMLHIKK